MPSRRCNCHLPVIQTGSGGLGEFAVMNAAWPVRDRVNSRVIVVGDCFTHGITERLTGESTGIIIRSGQVSRHPLFDGSNPRAAGIRDLERGAGRAVFQRQ
ncbi:hypothetical protein AB1L42_04350 [Thalassoglobus sp. JC818]|uniref:hypothetical protein n=1 Tax=Thalassoglobus sp. JC818 TaxID=3232136 RepID=UPI00345A7567